MTSRRLLVLGSVFALAVLSCGREPAGPGDRASGIRHSRGIAFNAIFPEGYAEYVRALRAQSPAAAAGNLANQSAGSVVDFDRVRIVLRNPDGSIAKDTIIEFPPGATQVPVTLTIPIPASAPASGLALTGTFAYMNGPTDVVLQTASPFSLTVVPAAAGATPPPPVVFSVPVVYVGPGASATTVQIFPSALTVNTGTSFTFTATARDASGNVTPGTPIVFESLSPSVASVDAASGQGTAGAARGTTTIRARLLSGASSNATLTVISPPATIAALSGGGQTANVNAQLANPVVVQVNATDGGPAAGVNVTFAAQNGGSVGSSTATTGADGRAQTTWRLGPGAGQQSLTATAPGLTGSPVSFSATALALPPVRLAFVQQPPASTEAGSGFGIVASAVDATGAVSTGFTGPVTVSLADGAPTGASLTGTTTVSAVAGIVTFANLRLNVAGTYALRLSNPNLAAAMSSGFSIVPGPARRLAFQSYPVAGAAAGETLDPVTVQVRDSLNNPVTTYTGPVTLSIGAPVGTLAASSASGDARVQTTPPAPRPPIASLEALTTVNAVEGLATFGGFRITVAGTYQFTASAAGLVTTPGPAFTVFPGPAAKLLVAGGSGQTAATGATLPIAVRVQVADAFGNSVLGAGRTITFTANAGGSASPASGSTNSAGSLSTTWTLGATPGAQTLTANSAGLASAVAGATATGAAPTGPTGPAYGYPVEFPGASSHSPNFLLGSLISVPSTSTLTHLSFIAKSGGQQVKMALYSDVSGSPGTLLAASTSTTVVVGVNDLPVSNVSLAPGNYWIMAIFNVAASTGIDFANSDVVKYIPLSFASPLPSTFPTPTVYTGQRFNYYIRVR